MILASDVKLLESEIMSDTSDAGGRRTSRVIPDGVAGNIFPKVSRLDSVYGRVNLRKVYGTVQVANVDTYAGAHAAIVDAPDNNRIHCTLFSTGSEFDTRATARDRIESYVTTASESRMTLVGRQLPGQQSILVYQRNEEPLPEVGEVFCLSNESGSVVTTQQYVRIQDFEHEIRTFTDDKGDFQRRVLNIDVGVPLRYEFSGPDTPSRYSGPARASKVRDTTVVDAARYFGIQKFALSAGQNDLEVTVQSVYTPIVPTTNRETAISNEGINEAVGQKAIRATTFSEAVTGFSSGTSVYTKRGILPGTLSVLGVVDNGLGVLSGTAFVGTVDYEVGKVTRTGGNGSSSSTLTYTPATSIGQPSETVDIPVGLNNRGTVYVQTLNPLPNPGTIIVDYRALGRWYRLRDDGVGTLSGTDSSYGVGTITYSTGALVLTLGALPDVDSSVLISWGTPKAFVIRADGTSNASTGINHEFTMTDLPVNPDSFALSYVSSGVTYTATDNASGVITGDGVSGTIEYTTGVVKLSFTVRLPDPATSISCTYNQITPDVPANPVIKSLSTTSQITTQLGGPIVAGSLVGMVGIIKNPFMGPVEVYDGGSGLLRVRAGQVVSTGNVYYKAVTASDTAIGTINYATGEVVINSVFPCNFTNSNPSSTTWATQVVNANLFVGSVASWGWKDSSAASSTTAKTFSASFGTFPLIVDLTKDVADDVVPGSVLFTAGGKTFIDHSGTIYTDVSFATGAGITAGTIDYATGKVSLSSWVGGAALSLSVQSCLTVYGQNDDYEFFLRTPGSPIRPGSFYVQVTSQEGVLLSGVSNDNGLVTGTKVIGQVNQETGVVRLTFGAMVTAAGNEAEWWYNAANIVGGMIFKPELVVPSTLAYSCVVLTNLPLNADILGLDPVRLPMDGRVPIYRPADVVVIHNTASTNLTNPVVAGATYALPRATLSEGWLTDANGVKLTSGQYAFDLTAGTVTMAADFVAGALVQPLKAYHRIEEMSLITDVQINGQLTLASPLSRAYDVNSFVSSALLFGDLNARVTSVFDLATFASWSDTPGAGSNAQYNNIDYPIEVLNNGAVTERWRINFTTTTAFQVIGENLGVIFTGSTASDCSPSNQLTGLPYFVLRAAGWGSGWAAGNQLRFNTLSAARPIWVARTILPGATLEGDSFSMQMRGDVDAV